MQALKDLPKFNCPYGTLGVALRHKVLDRLKG